MRPAPSLILAGCLLAAVQAQSLPSDPEPIRYDALQHSVVRIIWSRDLMNSGEDFRFAVNGKLIQNLMPRFQATYETDAWVFDDAGHVAAYLGAAGGWMNRGALQLTAQTTDGQCLPARLIGIDEAEGVAVIQTDPTSLKPSLAPAQTHWKPYSGFYVASLDKGISLTSCRLLNAQKQAGLAEHTLHFQKLRLGRPGSLVFTRAGEFAGFLTTALKGPTRTRDSADLMSAEQVIASARRIERAGNSIKSGWLGLFMKDQPLPPKPGAPAGVMVRRVVPGGPVAKVGIMENDLITKVNDIAAQSLSHAVRMIQRAPVGSSLKLEIFRDDKVLQFRPIVGTREDVERQPTYLVDVGRGENRTVHLHRAHDLGILKSRDAIFLGIYVSDSPESHENRGLVITEVMGNSRADQAGLRKGDVILRVNDAAVQSMDQYMTALMKSLTSSQVTFRCRRDQGEISKTIALR